MSLLQQEITTSQSETKQNLNQDLDRQMYNIQLSRPERQTQEMYRSIDMIPDNFQQLKTEEQFQFIHEQVSLYATQQQKQLQILEDYCYSRIAQVHDLIQTKEQQNQALQQKNNSLIYKQVMVCEDALMQDRNDIKKLTVFQQQLQNADQSVLNQLEQLKQQIQAQFQESKLQLYKEIETLKQQNIMEITQNINKASERQQEHNNIIKQEIEHNLKLIQDQFTTIINKVSTNQSDLEARQNKITNDIKEINQKIQTVIIDQSKFQQETASNQTKTSNSLSSVEQNFAQQQIQIQNGFNAVKQIQKQQQDAIQQIQNEMIENNGIIQGNVQVLTQTLQQTSNDIQALQVKNNVLNDQLQQYKSAPEEINSRIDLLIQKQDVSAKEIFQSLNTQQIKLNVIEQSQNQIQNLQNRADIMEREVKELTDAKNHQKEIISDYLAHILSGSPDTEQNAFWKRYNEKIVVLEGDIRQNHLDMLKNNSLINQKNDEFMNKVTSDFEKFKAKIQQEIDEQKREIETLKEELKKKNEEQKNFCQEQIKEVKKQLTEKFEKELQEKLDKQEEEIRKITQQQNKLNEQHDIGAFKEQIDNNVKEIQRNSEQILNKFDQTQQQQNKLLKTTVDETSKLILEFNNELDGLKQNVSKLQQESKDVQQIEEDMRETVTSEIQKFDISIKQYAEKQLDQRLKSFQTDNNKQFDEIKKTQKEFKNDVNEISKILTDLENGRQLCEQDLSNLKTELGETRKFVQEKIDSQDKKCDNLLTQVQEQMLQIETNQEQVNVMLKQRYAKISNNLQEQINKTLLDYQVQKTNAQSTEQETGITSDVSLDEVGENVVAQKGTLPTTFNNSMLKNILEQFKSLQMQFDQLKPIVAGEGTQGSLNDGSLVQKISKVEKSLLKQEALYRRLTSLLAPFIGTDLGSDPNNSTSGNQENGFLTLYNSTETRMLDLQQQWKQRFDEFTFELDNKLDKLEQQTKETVEKLQKGQRDQEQYTQKQVDRVIQSIIPQTIQQLQYKIQDVKSQLRGEVQQIQEYIDKAAGQKSEIIQQIIQLQLNPLNMRIDTFDKSVQRLIDGTGPQSNTLSVKQTLISDQLQNPQLQQVQKQISDVQSQIDKQKKQIEDLDTNIGEKLQQVQAETEKSIYNSVVDLQNEQKEMVDNKLRNLETKVEIADSRHMECIKVCATNIPTLIDNIKSLDKKFNTTVQKMQDQIQEIQAIEKEKHVCEHTQTINKLTQSVGEQALSIKQLQDAQSRQQQLIDFKLLQIAETDKLVKTIQQEFHISAEQCMSQVRQVDEQLKGRVSKLEAETSGVQGRIGSYTQQFEKIAERMSQAQHEQEQRFGDLRREVGREQQRLQELSADHQRFREEQRQFNTGFAERLDAGAESLDKAVSSLEQRVQATSAQLQQQIKVRADQCEQNARLTVDQVSSRQQAELVALRERVGRELEAQGAALERRSQVLQEQRQAFETQQLKVVRALQELAERTAEDFRDGLDAQNRQNKQLTDDLQAQLAAWAERAAGLETALAERQKAALREVAADWAAQGDRLSTAISKQMDQVAGGLKTYNTHLHSLSLMVVDHRIEAQKRIDGVDGRLLRLLDAARGHQGAVDEKLKTLETAFTVQQQQLDVVQTSHQQLEDAVKRDKIDFDTKIGQLEHQDEALSVKLSAAIRDTDARATDAICRADRLKQELTARIDELLTPLANPLYIQSVDGKKQQQERPKPGLRFVGFDHGDRLDTEVKSMAAGLRKALGERGVEARDVTIAKIKNGVYEAAGRRAQVLRDGDTLRVKTDAGTVALAEWLYDTMAGRE